MTIICAVSRSCQAVFAPICRRCPTGLIGQSFPSSILADAKDVDSFGQLPGLYGSGRAVCASLMILDVRDVASVTGGEA
jgi:hypothetical protein